MSDLLLHFARLPGATLLCDAPGEEIVSFSPRDPNGAWECDHCGRDNRPRDGACLLCGNSRTPDPILDFLRGPAE
jgi:hypothetical protein